MKEIDYNYKVKENIIRGFLSLLPRGEAIEKLLFSMKDARESVEQEKTYEFILSKLTDIQIAQLVEKNDLESIISLMNNAFEDLGELVYDFASFVESQNSFNSEIKKISEGNIVLMTKEFGEVNKKLDILLNRPESQVDKEVVSILFTNRKQSLTLRNSLYYKELRVYL